MLRSRTSSISRGNMVLFPPYHLGWIVKIITYSINFLFPLLFP
jgi:hypothetical protein